MVFDLIGAAVLMAFGILAMYFSIEGDAKDSKFLLIMLLGAAAVIAGGYILISRITLAVLLTKIAAIVLVLLGLFLIAEFPDVGDYQPEGFSKTGVFMGIVMFIIGIWLLVFA